MANKGIVISTVGITAVGIVKDVANKAGAGLGNVLVGGYVLGLLASLADLAGGSVSQIVGMIMGLALFSTIMYVLFAGGLFQKVFGQLQKGGSS